MSKPTINYWLDLLIGVTFIASAISGAVFLLPFPLESAGSHLCTMGCDPHLGQPVDERRCARPSVAALEMADAHDAQKRCCQTRPNPGVGSQPA